jgi:cytochrome c oxidase cbb3-type subunit 3
MRASAYGWRALIGRHDQPRTLCPRLEFVAWDAAWGVVYFVAAIAMATVVAACDGGAGAREWTPADHDNNAKANVRQVSGSVAPGQEDDTLIEVTWRQNCIRCHGPGGRGDGPEGRMVKTPDLTRADFQRNATDADIASVIKRGRNKMPAFETLPDSVVAGLVKHIRRIGGR